MELNFSKRDEKKAIYITNQLTAITNIFKDEEDRAYVDYLSLKHMSPDDLTLFMTSSIYAQMHLYKSLTGNKDVDILDFLAIQNRLIFQDAKTETKVEEKEKTKEEKPKKKRGRKKKDGK